MSNSNLRILRDMIADDALVLAEKDRHGNSILVLEERGESTANGPPGGDRSGSSSAYSVQIRKVPDDTLAIRADRFPKPKFKGSRGEQKRADFIIVAIVGAEKWILYVELKAGDKPLREIRDQLKGAKCLLAYCRAVGRTFWQQADFLDRKEYSQRFVSVARIRLNKKPTRRRRTSRMHDTPENMLRISSPANGILRFSSLLRGDADVG